MIGFHEGDRRRDEISSGLLIAALWKVRRFCKPNTLNAGTVIRA